MRPNSPKQGLALIMEQYPEVRKIVDNHSSPSEKAAEDINEFAATFNLGFTTSDRAVRRARQNSLKGLTDPNGLSENLEPDTPFAPSVEFEEDRANDKIEGVARIERKADQPIEDDEIFRQFGLDPAIWEISKLRKSRWDAPNGDKREAIKVEFSRRVSESTEPGTTLDFTDLERYLGSYPPYEKKKVDPNGRVLLFAIGDTQAGKPDGGGSDALVERFCAVVAKFKARLLENEGSVVVAPWLGDCIEGLVSQGGRMVAKLDLSVTEQVRLIQRLMVHMIRELAPHTSSMIIPVVGGNHDEAYRLQDQGPNDSWAIQAGASVKDALDFDPVGFGHVKFVFPKDGELGVTLTINGGGEPYKIHFEHGHMAKSPEKMVDWWKGQAMGGTAAGQANMLMTAHWHHLRVQQTYGRVWLQIPALEGGSDWYTQRTGDHSPAGAISMEIIGGPVGFSDLTVHTA